MKHYNYNTVYPYTYYVKHLETNIKYYGVRYGNVRNNVTPNDDFGFKYFTSIESTEFMWFKDLFMSNPECFEYRIHYTFDDYIEAISYEQSFIRKILRKKDWANMSMGKCIVIKGRAYKNICCTYCRMELDPGNYSKSHGDKCKKSPNYLLYYKPRSDYFKEHMSNKMTGRGFTPETRLKMSSAQKNRVKKHCNYCDKYFDPGNYGRSHGEKCKIKTA